MSEFKIVFSGTTGAGKTTAIGAISDTAPIKTDVHNTDATLAKEFTTVGLDYGQLTMDNGDRIRLFGTPGQSRFEFMWKILAKDALGLIILIDNSRLNPVDDLAGYITAFREHLNTTPCVVGVGRTEAHPQPAIDDFSEYLHQQGITVPVIPVDVRIKEDVLLLLHMLLAQIEAELN